MLTTALLALHLAAPAMPETDIYLYELVEKDGGPSLGRGKPLSVAPGYDNQPSFTPDGRFVLYTAQRDGQQTEIWRYDLASGETRQLTRTPESEYSPQLAPDGKHFTAVRVEVDGTQRLWRFRTDGSAAEPVLKTIKPVGYYAYSGPEVVYAFILGDPHSLQRIRLADESVGVKAKNIGRCLAAVDGGLSYVQMGERGSELHRINANGEDMALFSLPEGTAGDYAWLPGGQGVLAGKDRRLLSRRLDEPTWHPLAGNPDLPGELSRLAVSPDGRWLALVAQAEGH